MADYDVFIVGGGINGCGIARDAAGRGFSVGLAEMNDLASGTSSWSTKLIHGGLRYLEHYEFSLVRHALNEREKLWAIAPHIIRPLRFVLPHHKGLRPAVILRIGLFLYDHIGGRKKLKKTTAVDLDSGPLGEPLKDEFRKGFEYSDARVDDARLVVLNARDAAAHGADIMVRTKVTEARREGDLWKITVRDQSSGADRSITAKCLVNMGGPWVDEVIRGAIGRNEAHNIRLVQGSHLVTTKLYDHDRAYIFQNGDGRIIFTIPYEDDYTLVGTTDQDFDGDPSKVAISESETEYLLSATSEYLKRSVGKEDIVWTYSGVRPLFDDGASKAQEATRDYVLKLEGKKSEAPLVNGFGGKITTYRVLSEEVLEMIESRLGSRKKAWTAERPLPGGDFPVDGVAALENEISNSAPELDERTRRRLVRSYGTDAKRFAQSAQLGCSFGHGLYEAEIDWMIEHEWARTSEDVLWRRSKLGLRFSEDEAHRVGDHVSQKIKGMTAAA